MLNSQPESDKKAASSRFTLDSLIVTIMMVCFSIVLISAVRSAMQTSNPGWTGNYLIFLSFLVSLEALISFRTIKDATIFDSNPILIRITEWIVILISTKILLYLLVSPAQLLVDISLWRENLLTFFSGLYVATCFYLFFIWLLTEAFANILNHLEDDVDLLELERQGYARTNRTDIRQGLMGLIFGLGAVMVFFATLTHLSLPFITFLANPLLFDVSFILLFFVSGFVLLARSQFTVMRARWYLESIPMTTKVPSRWMLYAVAMVITIALIVIFLPTGYSLGALDLIRSIIQGFTLLLSFIELIILGPIIALLTLLVHLLGGGGLPPAQEVIPTPVPPPPPAITAGTGPAWLDIVKSIAFWAIFIIVIIYSIRHYILNHKGVLVGSWFGNFMSPFQKVWSWLGSLFGSANRQMTNILQKSISRIRSIVNPKSLNIDPLAAISTLLPARQRIQLMYLSMIRWNSHHGIPRKGSQTPNEYAESLNSSIPEANEAIEKVTAAFIEARYTRHPISAQNAILAQESIQRIQDAIHSLQEQKQQTENHL